MRENKSTLACVFLFLAGTALGMFLACSHPTEAQIPAPVNNDARYAMVTGGDHAPMLLDMQTGDTWQLQYVGGSRPYQWASLPFAVKDAP